MAKLSFQKFNLKIVPKWCDKTGGAIGGSLSDLWLYLQVAKVWQATKFESASQFGFVIRPLVYPTSDECLPENGPKVSYFWLFYSKNFFLTDINSTAVVIICMNIVPDKRFPFENLSYLFDRLEWYGSRYNSRKFILLWAIFIEENGRYLPRSSPHNLNFFVQFLTNCTQVGTLGNIGLGKSGAVFSWTKEKVFTRG